MARHFTVSLYIVHKDKVLLHLHKKAKKILPLGGHIEPNVSDNCNKAIPKVIL